MIPDLLRRRDLVAGLVFALAGAATIAASAAYPLGSAMRMGPGYFPRMLGALLVGLGVLIGLAALRGAERERLRRVALRPVLLVGGGVLLFAVSVASAGLALAALALVVVSGLAHDDADPRELGLLGVALAAFAVIVFAWGLRLPLPAFPV